MNTPADLLFNATRRVQYGDLDAFGFVYFPNFVRYMEETEYAWLRSHNLSVVLSDEKGSIGFPRLSAEFEIVENIGFGAIMAIEMKIAPCNGKNLQYTFDIQSEGRPVANGRFVAACCRFPENGVPYAIPIPPWVMNNLFGENIN